jgi:hypothetical protein
MLVTLNHDILRVQSSPLRRRLGLDSPICRQVIRSVNKLDRSPDFVLEDLLGIADFRRQNEIVFDETRPIQQLDIRVGRISDVVIKSLIATNQGDVTRLSDRYDAHIAERVLARISSLDIYGHDATQEFDNFSIEEL